MSELMGGIKTALVYSFYTLMLLFKLYECMKEIKW
jgi:hypothetical protein